MSHLSLLTPAMAKARRLQGSTGKGIWRTWPATTCSRPTPRHTTSTIHSSGPHRGVGDDDDDEEEEEEEEEDSEEKPIRRRRTTMMSTYILLSESA